MSLYKIKKNTVYLVKVRIDKLKTALKVVKINSLEIIRVAFFTLVNFNKKARGLNKWCMTTLKWLKRNFLWLTR